MAAIEEWLLIRGYTLYEVSNLGRVRRVGSEKPLRPLLFQNGYLVVVLYEDGRRTVNVHRCVALAFIPNPEEKRCVDHINRDKQDNRAENLRWASHSENGLNRAGHSKSGLPKGVKQNHNRYSATFRDTYIGTYNTPEEAHAAYVAAGLTYNNEFFAA